MGMGQTCTNSLEAWLGQVSWGGSMPEILVSMVTLFHGNQRWYGATSNVYHGGIKTWFTIAPMEPMPLEDCNATTIFKSYATPCSSHSREGQIPGLPIPTLAVASYLCPWKDGFENSHVMLCNYAHHPEAVNNREELEVNLLCPVPRVLWILWWTCPLRDFTDPLHTSNPLSWSKWEILLLLG